MRVALITGAQMAKPDPESYLLIEELHKLGISSELVSWRASLDWSSFDLVVIRTPWDYFLHLEEFLSWVEVVEQVTRVLNSSRILRWNSHKKYLKELSGLGVPTVPTVWVDRHQACEGLMDSLEWPIVVVKPAVSIGAIGALKGQAQDAQVQEHLKQELVKGDVMIQPFLESVADFGELSLIYFSGIYSHAILKKPQKGDYRVQDAYGGTNSLVQADVQAQQIGNQVLSYLPDFSLYARVDLVKYQNQWLLMELEAIEPELFLPIAPQASMRFAAAIQSHINR
jgi:glutathione synthase/RimK-type ligase-like ATP-grasp enzyme